MFNLYYRLSIKTQDFIKINKFKNKIIYQFFINSVSK